MEFRINTYTLSGSHLNEFNKELSDLYSQVEDNLEGLFAEDVARHWSITDYAPRAVITNIENCDSEVVLTVAEYDHDFTPFIEMIAGRFDVEVC
ncbi:MAG: hypothetical protein KBT28_12105 [Bacteroidales bacterium]|nr:hypothetical protein [Candidatus Colimorpha merdihippi]